ncbi:MAG: ElyC/SanA/YdcF family protein [Hyphomonas sp.]|uniref:YdcF family protein n=1 Tax=Hyphomonas sp. TaxID=87 RepID=UPI0030017DE7
MPKFLSDNDIELTASLLFRPVGSPPPDVALVFGSGHHAELLADACVQACQAYQLRAVVLSGHQGEAEQLLRLVLDKGMVRDLAVVERHASNTSENVLYSLPALRKATEQRSVAAVCKLYSACRVWLTMQKELTGWALTMVPVDWLLGPEAEWYRSVSFLSKVTEEFQKIIEYELRGDIAPISELGLSTEEFSGLLGRIDNHRQFLEGVA